VNNNHTIISTLASIPVETKVQVLMNLELGVWKPDLIHQLFLPHEASAILSIPLNRHCPPDKIIWAHSSPGSFTTCSAYELLIACEGVGQAGSSNADPQNKFWKGVWSLQVPHKIKHFIWRACNDALPTMNNLFRRQVLSSDRCELCQLYPQDPLHALWSCKEVETAWNSLNCLQQPSHPQPPAPEFLRLTSLFFVGAG